MRSIVWAVVLLTACSSRRVEPVTRFTGDVPLQVTVRGSLYAGTATLTRTAAQAVTGTFVLAGPVEVRGTVSGQIDTAVKLELIYAIAANGCKGTMRLAAPTNETALVQGAVEAQDSCVGRMTGTFKLGRS